LSTTDQLATLVFSGDKHEFGSAYKFVRMFGRFLGQTRVLDFMKAWGIHPLDPWQALRALYNKVYVEVSA
jgi:hypothetical protein